MRDILGRETVERPTSKQGAPKVAKISTILVANNQEVRFKHLLSSVVHMYDHFSSQMNRDRTAFTPIYPRTIALFCGYFFYMDYHMTIDDTHVILDTRPSHFSACNIEKLGRAWGRG